MDKASDFGSEDCRFESCHGRRVTFLFIYGTFVDYQLESNFFLFFIAFFSL